jgi:hypothetical protein
MSATATEMGEPGWWRVRVGHFGALTVWAADFAGACGQWWEVARAFGLDVDKGQDSCYTVEARRLECEDPL